MTALKALGWSAAILVFCGLIELMLRFFGWMRDRGLGSLLTGDRWDEVWFGRFMQVCVLGIGIVGLVQILTE
jgi:hypothetical protein